MSRHSALHLQFLEVDGLLPEIGIAAHCLRVYLYAVLDEGVAGIFFHDGVFLVLLLVLVLLQTGVF